MRKSILSACMIQKSVKACIFILMLAGTVISAFGQGATGSFSIQVGPGTLSYTQSEGNEGTCPVGSPSAGPFETIVTYNVTNATYTAPGISQSWGNVITQYLQSPGGQYCPASGWTLNPVPLSGPGFSILFTPSLNGAGSGSFSANVVTQVSSTLDPSVYGQPVTFTSIVSTGGIAPSGPVVFEDGSTSIGTGTLSAVSTKNLVPYSQQIGNSTWGGYCGSLSDAKVNATDYAAPDGTYTATKFVVPSSLSCSGSGAEGAIATIAGGLAAGQSYTASVWMRGANGGEAINFGLNDCASTGVTLTTVWQRYTVTFPSISSGISGCESGTGVRGFQVVDSATPSATYYVWGAQVEASSSEGPYVETTVAAQTGSGAVATFTSSTLGAGPHSISGTYNQSQYYSGSTFTPITQTVNPATPSVSVSCSPNPITYGSQTTNCTTSVSGGATGNITWTINGSAWTSNSLSNGAASASGFNGYAAGTYTVGVTYSGDANNNGGSASTSLTISKASPSISVACSPNPITYGSQTTNCTTSVSGGATGNITWTINGSAWTSKSLSNGSASASGFNGYAAGTYTVGVTYSGDANNNGGSASTSLTISKATPSISVACSPNPIVYGSQTTNCTTSVSGGATGNITWTINGSAWTSNSLSNGTASASGFNGYAAGTYTVGVTYSGDTNNNGGSASTSLTISKATSSVSVSCSPNTVIYGSSGTNCTTSVSGGATGNITWTINGSAWTSSSLNNGTATASGFSGYAAGTYTIAVTYSGDANNNPGSASTTQTVTKATQTINFSAPSSVTYGVAPIALSATGGSSGNPVVFSIISGPGTISGNTLNITGAGTVTIAANQVGNANYGAAAQITQSITVGRASLTVTAQNASRFYSAPNPTFTDSFTGFVNGDTVSTATTGIASLTTTATATSPVGSYTIAANAGTLSAPNYIITFASGTLTVARATPTVHWSAPASITNATPLSGVQLNATVTGPSGASALGSVLYTPAAGTYLATGTTTLSVTFTPSDTTDYNSVTDTVPLTVVASWTINTAAGDGVSGYSGNAGPAISAELYQPQGVAVDAAGNFYIGDAVNNVVRKVTASTGIITTVAGNGSSGYSGDGSAATNAELYHPAGVAVDASGNVYIADPGNGRIRKVTASTGIITTVAGNGTSSFSGDGGAATSAGLCQPVSVAVDTTGNLYIGDYCNNRVRKVTAAGIISTLAGIGPNDNFNSGYSGDGGQATSAQLNLPTGVALDSTGNVYIADTFNNRIREVVVSTGIINTVAGNGISGYSGAGGPATSANLSFPEGVAVDAQGNIFLSNTDANVICEVEAASGFISVIAGTGVPGSSGDGGPATSAELYQPVGLALTSARTLYVADSLDSRIRDVSIGRTSPVITWATPVSIIYGTPLSSAQLNASANLAGSYSYSPLPGTVLPAGSNTVSVTFTPTDIADFTPATDSVPILVNQATPAITWAPPADIASGTALSGTQLNASSTVAGKFSYSPAAGTVLTQGPHTLTVTFTPTDTVDYTAATGTAYIDVTPDTGIWDSGTVTLTVNNSTVASASYGKGSTASSVATALAGSLSSSAPVTVTVVDNALYLTAKTAGSASDYTYSLQATQFDSTDFSLPSFAYPTLSGSLDGGAAGQSSGTTVYSYTVPSGGYDSVGNLKQSVDSVMGTWSFSYDALNRLGGATDNQPNSTSTNYCWAYDSFGNRKIQSGSSAAFQTGSTAAIPCTPATSATTATTSAAYNAGNQIIASTQTNTPAPTYDASGDVVNDGAGHYQYLYDADGRICAVANSVSGGLTVMTGYIYDAEGTRVAKGAITAWSCDPSISGFTTASDYVIGPGGKQMSEFGMDANNKLAWQHSNVYAAGKLLATYDADGLHFYLDDPLGSRRVQTDYAGVVEQSCASLPFGDNLACSGSTLYPTEHHFTGKERDQESGLDYFGARYYASSMGRWMSPDKVNVTEDRMMNPSSTLNKYAYAANNPLLYTDPDGEDITIFYEPANLLAGSPGHTMLLAYDQSNGQSAIRSFGPDYANGASVLGTLGSTPGTDSFGFQNIHSPDDLRAAYKSITIQTSPEEAEAVIAEIKAHPDGNYSILSKNCTTTCSKILRNLGKTKSKSITPGGFFSDLCAQYGCHPPPGPNGHDLDQRGMMFGNPRPGYNPFQLFFNDIPRGNPEGTPKRNTDPPCLKNRDTGGCA